MSSEKNGAADEAWKVSVCARDLKDLGFVLAKLDSILHVGPTHSREGLLDRLRAMTGEELVDALTRYRGDIIQSVRLGNPSLRGEPDDEVERRLVSPFGVIGRCLIPSHEEIGE